jgi:hypothetical protein
MLGCRLQSEEKATAERPHMGRSGACSIPDEGSSLFGAGVIKKFAQFEFEFAVREYSANMNFEKSVQFAEFEFEF